MVRGWAWLGVLLGGVALFEIVRRVLIETENPNLVPSLILLGAAVAPASFVTFVLGRRLPYDVSGGTIGVVAFLGGLVGVVTAGLLEYDTLRGLGVLPMVAVGLIEEAAKLIVPVVLLVVLRRHRRPADGLLVGVAAGAGFAALETMGYAFVTLISSKGNVGAVQDILLLRGLLSPAAHMAWTGLTATALWYAADQGWKGAALLRFLAVFVLAVALHTIWDSAGTIPVYIVLAVISLGLLTWFAHLLARGTRMPAVLRT
ncbi:MAG TPA: PrsW family glutamic-type intramembrane protease [Mycobacteriales bacterium]|jgi:RsiW-degrading membrane proteinase PrsW (M82 family)|nr:PrsW family glutamic-type intramembrane protease [Mycobacteriales bacterium]